MLSSQLVPSFLHLMLIYTATVSGALGHAGPVGGKGGLQPAAKIHLFFRGPGIFSQWCQMLVPSFLHRMPIYTATVSAALGHAG